MLFFYVLTRHLKCAPALNVKRCKIVPVVKNNNLKYYNEKL